MKIEIKSINHLEQVLAEHGIETATWGLGESRTLFELYCEIVSGETELFLDDDGKLYRTLHVVGIVVTCQGRRLKEDRQEFVDGRKRHRNLSVSCAEKIIKGETPKQAAVRCLKEELGINVHETEVIAKVNHSNTEISSSYPGLNSVYYRNPFEYEMKPEFFKEEGYQEFQENKTTYFIWE